MKSILIALVLVITGVFLCYAEVKQDAQKFKVIYTITYNAQTLGEAARMETVVKSKFKDACSAKVEIKVLEEGIVTGGTFTIIE